MVLVLDTSLFEDRLDLSLCLLLLQFQGLYLVLYIFLFLLFSSLLRLACLLQHDHLKLHLTLLSFQYVSLIL